MEARADPLVHREVTLPDASRQGRGAVQNLADQEVLKIGEEDHRAVRRAQAPDLKVHLDPLVHQVP